VAEKTTCRLCGAAILKATAERCRGLCMPCFKKPFVVRVAQRIKKMLGLPRKRRTDPGAVLRLWDLLGYQDAAARAALEEAVADPADAKRRHQSEDPDIRHVRNDEIESVVWVLFQRYAEERGQLIGVDWRAAPEDIPEEAWSFLSSCAGLDVRGLQLPPKAEDFIRVLNDALKAKGYRFVDFSPGSDTSTLLVVPSEQAKQVAGIATQSKLTAARVL
jgi:hypothetical protein